MHIRQCIKSLQDLELRFSPLLKRRVERLVRAYQKVLHVSVEPLIIRAVCLAISFADVAQGDVAKAESFDDMMHGRTQERLEYKGCELVFSEDDSAQEQLVWDTFCLVLEEYVPNSQMPQQAYDIAAPHARLAYKEEVMNDAPMVPTVVQVKPQPVHPTLTNGSLMQSKADEVTMLRRQLAQVTEERNRYRDELQMRNGQIAALEKELEWHRTLTQRTTDALLAKLSLPNVKTDNHFDADSCHFGTGSTMNGNIG